MMTPERVSIEAQVAARQIIAQARPDQLRRLIDDIRQPAPQEVPHGA